MTQLKKDLRTTLQESLDQAEWSWLMPHLERQCIIVVSQDLDIVEVGIQIVEDNVPSVQEWIRREQIQKPTPIQIRGWEQNSQKRFNVLIVQPYVLIQERAH